MKVYEIKKKDNAPNVFGISLVKTPAMESDYVFLKKQEEVLKLSINEKIALSKKNDIKLSVIDKKKRLLLGLVLEPDKDIYRYNPDTNEEYFLRASAETVSDLAYHYTTNANKTYSTLEHDGKELEGVSFVEHWIVEDTEIDKSALHGLKFKKGSWATVSEITNDTLWNNYITTGEVLGFSIDALVHLEEVNLNKQETMVTNETLTQLKSDIIDGFRSVMKLAKKEEPKEVELKDDEKKEVKYEDMTDEQKKAFDAKKKAKKEDEVDKDKVIMSEVEKFDMEAFKQAMTEMGVEFSTVVKEALEPLETKNVELAKEVEALQEKVVELSKQPASKAIKTAPTQVDFSKMSNFEKLKYNRENRL